MIAVHGTLQREGEVIHIVTDRLEDLTPLLHQVGAMQFPHRPGPADGARNGGYDPRDGPPRTRRRHFPPAATAACASARAISTEPPSRPCVYAARIAQRVTDRTT